MPDENESKGVEGDSGGEAEAEVLTPLQREERRAIALNHQSVLQVVSALRVYRQAVRVMAQAAEGHTWLTDPSTGPLVETFTQAFKTLALVEQCENP